MTDELETRPDGTKRLNASSHVEPGGDAEVKRPASRPKGRIVETSAKSVDESKETK